LATLTSGDQFGLCRAALHQLFPSRHRFSASALRGLSIGLGFADLAINILI
jgi:hypothetical protein